MNRNQCVPQLRRHIRISIAALALGLPVAVPAADDVTADGATGGEDSTQLELITVSGDKLGREVSESSASVGVATEEDLQSSSDRKMQETVSRFGNVLRVFNDRELAIRGIPQNGISGQGETISVYLDGVPLTDRAADFAGPLSTFDLQRVEVFRGPQSTAQGRNSLAGAVFLETHDATSEWDVHAKASGSSRNGHQYGFAGGGPLIGDQLRFRVSAEDRYEDGDIYNVTTARDDAGREDVETQRARLTFAPDTLPGYRARLSVTRGKTEFGDNVFDVSNGERTASSNIPYIETYEGEVYSLRQNLLLGSHFDVTAVTGWIDGDGFRRADFDRTEQEMGFSTFDLMEERFTQELRLNFDYDGVRGVIGLYYEDTENSLRNNGNDILAGGGLLQLNGIASMSNQRETVAAFGEMDWRFLPDWRLTLGLRLNREDSGTRSIGNFNSALTLSLSDLADLLNVPLQPLLDQLPNVVPAVPLTDNQLATLSDLVGVPAPTDYDISRDQTFETALPKIGITWQFLDPHSVSLTYQEGFRSGGTSVTLFGGRPSVFDPERTRNVELALRTRWLQRSMEVNLNVFYTDWEDQQVTIGNALGFNTFTTNAGESHLYGGEVEWLWRFARHLESFASLGVLETEFDDFQNQDRNFAGNEFPYAPDYNATVGIGLLPWRGLDGQIYVQYVDEYFSQPSNAANTLVGGRTLLNARVAYDLGDGLSLFLFGRNLTDDENIQGQVVQSGRTARRYGEARTVGFGVEWQP